MLPLAVPSGLAVRRTRTEDGFRDDPVAVRQLEVIRRLLREADGAVTATDTSREGQMVARNLYDYLGFKGKTERLWLSSLTDKAIREAFLDLRPDSLYEGLYLAGRARREADRIIGYNASLALGMAAGKRTTRSDGYRHRYLRLSRAVTWRTGISTPYLITDWSCRSSRTVKSLFSPARKNTRSSRRPSPPGTGSRHRVWPR